MSDSTSTMVAAPENNGEAMEMPVLSKDAILGANDIKVEPCPVPEWGGAVFLRVISGAERDRFEASIASGGKKRNLENFRARFAALVVCDAEGNPMFNESDIAALTKKSAAALDRIFEAGQRLNHMTEDDVEELVKN